MWSGKLAMEDAGSDDESGQHGGGGSSHRSFRSQLDKALTARQEAEAKVTTLEEKIKLYESENVQLKQKVNYDDNVNDQFCSAVVILSLCWDTRAATCIR